MMVKYGVPQKKRRKGEPDPIPDVPCFECDNLSREGEVASCSEKRDEFWADSMGKAVDKKKKVVACPSMKRRS